MYLQCPSKKSRTATILFYAVCLLYVLSTITFAGDLVACIIEVSEYSSTCKNIIFLSVVQLNIQSDFMLRLLLLIQITLSGCCDFIAQCIIVCINHCHHPFNSRRSSKIYRCWIVWGQNIGVVIIPSFLAIAFLGQSINLHAMGGLNLLPLATWLATDGAPILVHGQYFYATWMFQMTLTSFGLSMTVHALVTCLIVFRILKVFLGN